MAKNKDKTLENLKKIVEAFEEVKAYNIRIYYMEDNPFYDYGIIATSVASRQGTGLINKLYEKALEFGFKVRGYEGKGGSDWILVDCEFCIANLMTLEERSRIDLDKIWGHHKQLDPVTFEEI